MNIFVLDLDPKTCALYHCNKHVTKMVVETAQLLSTAHHVNGTSIGDLIYKPTHVNGSCALWARESLENYQWLLNLGIELSKEYTHRYGKIHKTSRILDLLSSHYPVGSFPKQGLTAFPQVMPDEYRAEDAVAAYQSYYIGDKKHILKYTKRKIPEFLKAHI